MEIGKKQAAKAAIQYIEEGMTIGVGTGSTVEYFIEELATIKHRIEATVASSKTTEILLNERQIPVIDLNATSTLALYIDGADEVRLSFDMIKGGGGALTREKIIATAAKQFICIVDALKVVSHLGEFPLPIEVIPMARSFVAREIVKLGGSPKYREGFVTDNGNIILDIYNLRIDRPIFLENTINCIPGVVENGIFANRLADIVLVGSEEGVKEFRQKTPQ
jgi:ribose 5-phosphate isomerase A